MLLNKKMTNIVSNLLFTVVTVMSPLAWSNGESSAPPAADEAADKMPKLVPGTEPFFQNSVQQVRECSQKKDKLLGNDCNKDSNTSLLAGSTVVKGQAATTDAASTKDAAVDGQTGGATALGTMEVGKKQCEDSFLSCNDSCSEARKTIESEANTCLSKRTEFYQLQKNPNAAALAKKECSTSASDLTSAASKSRNKCIAAKAAFVGLALLAIKGLMDYMKKSKEVEKKADSDVSATGGGSGLDSLPEKFCREGDLKCICTSSKAASDKRCGCFDTASSSSTPNDRCMCQKYGNETEINTAYRCSERGIKPIADRLLNGDGGVGPVTSNSSNSTNSNSNSSNTPLVNVAQGSDRDTDRTRPSGVAGMVAGAGAKAYDESIENSPIRNPSSAGAGASGETGSTNGNINGAMVAGSGSSFSAGSAGSYSGGGMGGSSGEIGSAQYKGVAGLGGQNQSDRGQVASAHGPSIFQLVRAPYAKYSQKMLP